MFQPITFSKFVLALALAASPVAVMAQEAPVQDAQQAPSQDQVIKGRIASIDSKFAITVNDERGYVDNVQLHQGTIINPTGLTLAPGMTVTIAGYNAGNAFAANQIDTPYAYNGPPPVPVYYGPGYWYPGFAYGYGPSFSLFVSSGAPFVAIARPWYGFWYVNPYVVPWAGYRAPWPAPFICYRNVTINNYGAWNGSRNWGGWNGNGWQNNGQNYQNHSTGTTVPPNEQRSSTTPQLASRSAVPAPGSGATAPSYGRSAAPNYSSYGGSSYGHATAPSAYRAQASSASGGGHYGGGGHSSGHAGGGAHH